MAVDPATEEHDTGTGLALPGPKSGRGALLVGLGLLTAAIAVLAASDSWGENQEQRQLRADTKSTETKLGRLSDSSRDRVAIRPASEWAITEGALRPSRPFKHSGSAEDRAKAIDCLAFASWYEAGDSPPDQRAVMQTILNRVSHTAFPNSVCGVVFEGSHLATGCQFTFTCDGSIKARRPSEGAMTRARKLAKQALDGQVDDSIGTATHYHANYVDPWWASRLDRVAIVGPHIFYKWRGSAGVLAKPGRLDKEVEFRELAAKHSDYRAAKSDPTIVAEQNPQLAQLSGIAPSPIATARAISSNIHYTAVGSETANGRWALSALKTCRGEKSCQVIGYSDGAEAARNRNAELSARDRPLFLFVRDAATGMEIALWDCEKVTRKNSSQCLPGERAALHKLMKERS